MIQRLRFIFLKRHVHLKPIESRLFQHEAVLLEQNLFESFADDRRRYGVRVALANFRDGIPLLSQRWERRRG